VWSTFYPREPPDPLAAGFGPLEELLEIRLRPGAVLRSGPQGHGEVITYVREGSLSWSDSTGRSGVISAGEFLRTTDALGIQHSDANASLTVPAHLFRARLRASVPGPGAGPEHNRFFVSERRRSLCTVASPDGRRGSLHLHLDTVVYSTLLFDGQHVVYELPAGRSAWLHIVQGQVSIQDTVLTTGDGIGISAQLAVSFTAHEETEVLLFDVGVPVELEQAGPEM
jgi:redox-sensitive bicupin YhaK (pirin superfamily)